MDTNQSGPKRVSKTEDLLDLYRSRVSDMGQPTETAEWEKYWKAYEKVKSPCPPGCRTTESNQIRPIIEQMTVSTVSQSAEFGARPLDPSSREKAILASRWLTDKYSTLRFGRSMVRAYKDTLVVGLGVLKVGWVRAGETSRKPTPEERREYRQQLVDQRALAQMTDASSELANLSDEKILDMARSFNEIKSFAHSAPTCEYVNPQDMMFDPCAASIVDARWIAQKRDVTAEQLLDEVSAKGWRESALKDLCQTHELNQTFAPDDSNLVDETKYTIYEMWDLERCKFSVFGATNGDRKGNSAWLVEPRQIPDEYMRAGCGDPRMTHPFVLLCGTFRNDKRYPEGEVKYLLDLQSTINETWQDMLSWTQNNKNIHVAPPGYGDEDFQKKIRSGENGQILVAPTDEAWEAIADKGLVPVTSTQMPFDFYAMLDRIERQIQTEAGLSDYQVSGSPRTRTATEAAILASSAKARVDARTTEIELGLQRIGRLMVALAETQLQKVEWVELRRSDRKIFDELGAAYSQTADVAMAPFSGSELMGSNLDVYIVAGQSRPRSPDDLREGLLNLMSAVPAVQALLMATGLTLDGEALIRAFVDVLGLGDASQFITAATPVTPEVLPQSGTPEGGPSPAGTVPTGPPPQTDPAGFSAQQQLQGQVGLPA